MFDRQLREEPAVHFLLHPATGGQIKTLKESDYGTVPGTLCPAEHARQPGGGSDQRPAAARKPIALSMRCMSAKPPQALTALPLKCKDDSVAVALMVQSFQKQEK